MFVMWHQDRTDYLIQHNAARGLTHNSIEKVRDRPNNAIYEKQIGKGGEKKDKKKTKTKKTPRKDSQFTSLIKI